MTVGGALARTVKDAAILLSAMTIPSDRSARRLRHERDRPDFASWMVAGSLRDLTLSAPPSLAATTVAVGVRTAVDALRDAGAAVTDEAPPLKPEPSTVLSTVAAAGAASDYRALVAGRHEDLSDYARRSLKRGAALTETAVAAAYAEVDRLRVLMESFFEHYDGLVLPTTATTAPRSGVRVTPSAGESVNPWLISTLHTPVANLIHAPAIAVPTGLDDDGLPMSVQIVAPPGEEATVLRCAAVLEQAIPWDYTATRRSPDPRRDSDLTRRSRRLGT